MIVCILRKRCDLTYYLFLIVAPWCLRTTNFSFSLVLEHYQPSQTAGATQDRKAKSIGNQQSLSALTTKTCVSALGLGAERPETDMHGVCRYNAATTCAAGPPATDAYDMSRMQERERERETTVVANKQVTLVRSKHTLVRSTVMSI